MPRRKREKEMLAANIPIGGHKKRHPVKMRSGEDSDSSNDFEAE